MTCRIPFLLVFLLVGCEPDPIDGSRDRDGGLPDAGSVRDSGSPRDAGPPPDDAGDALDGGDAVDAGSEVRCMNDPTRPCGATGYCDYDAQCGETGDPMGRCRPLPTRCEVECAPVCGCNGVTYINECEAQRAGTDVAQPGACDCDAQDAVGSGSCGAPFGYKWNGTSCVEVRGCTCEGADCGRLRNFPECQMHAEVCEGGTCM
jgi:hypothetical protein